MKTKEDRQMENYRKMILAMAKDVRVVLLNWGPLHIICPPKSICVVISKKRITKETLEILGTFGTSSRYLQCEMGVEDLSFRYLEPENTMI